MERVLRFSVSFKSMAGLEQKNFALSRYQEIMLALYEGGLDFQPKNSWRDGLIYYSWNSDDGRKVAAGYLNAFGEEIVIDVFLMNEKHRVGGPSLRGGLEKV